MTAELVRVSQGACSKSRVTKPIMLSRLRQYSQKRRQSRNWRLNSAAHSVAPPRKAPLIVENTNLTDEQQSTAIEITTQALEKCGIENEIATFIKTNFDDALGPTWHCIVGRNFGSHIAYESFIHFSVAKVTIVLFKCG